MKSHLICSEKNTKIINIECQNVCFMQRSTGEGWVAIDEVIASEEYDGNCPTVPESSAMTTIAPDTTTTEQEPGTSPTIAPVI
jgi:hypothetical protein